MSRIIMALLGLLAYKAFNGGGRAAPNDPGSNPTDTSATPRRWL
jgi:hypothetical protein